MIRQHLIQSLEAVTLLDGRYESIKCINFNSVTGEKQGFFSLVFKAHDKVENRTVVLKFFDPEQLSQQYRIASFKREPEILKALINKNRCLQLVRGLKEFPLKLKIAGSGTEIELRFEYFVLEWLSDGIEHYFAKQESHDPETKLRLFNDVVLAVEMLHQNNVFHRDAKPENFRAYNEELKRIVVAIDLGTAARYESKAILTEYRNAVGDLLYAAPEAICGLAGDRTIARYSDCYALGCMLYELFNVDFFGARLHGNALYHATITAMQLELSKASTDSKRVEAWISKAPAFRHTVELPSMDDAGSTIPLSIVTELNSVLWGLVSFDFQTRSTDFIWIRQKIWSAITVLRNTKAQAERIRRKKLERAARVERARQKDLRVQQLFEQRKLRVC